MYQIYQGDCLEVMPMLENQSIDAIITDPPYGTTACKWDSVIPFAPMWENVKQLLKHTRSILLFGNEPFSSTLRVSNIQWFKYDWMWVKNRPTGAQHSKNRPMGKHETISVFSNGSMGHVSLLHDKRQLYNPQGVIELKEKPLKKKDFTADI